MRSSAAALSSSLISTRVPNVPSGPEAVGAPAGAAGVAGSSGVAPPPPRRPLTKDITSATLYHFYLRPLTLPVGLISFRAGESPEVHRVRRPEGALLRIAYHVCDAHRGARDDCLLERFP